MKSFSSRISNTIIQLEVMKTNLHTLPVLAALAAVGGLLASCSGKKADEVRDHASLPEEVEPVATAIINDSASQFAQAVYYPLERPYPLKSIEDSAQMVEYFPTLVDDSLRTEVSESPDTLWQQIGWRGWTLGDGSYLWIDDGKVYCVNYVSQRENVMLDSLRASEISTLAPSLREGWIPVLCAVDSVHEAVFRIDRDGSEDNPVYRLAGYEGDCDLSATPVILLFGTLETEGSMATRYYNFKDSVGNTAVYSPDVESDDTLPALDITVRGDTSIYRVHPAYWLDLYHRRTANNHGADSIARCFQCVDDVQR